MNNKNKLALLIGINYKGTENELNGCINDVENVKKLLINKFNYAPENIMMLTDETEKKPTGNNILYNIYQLLIKTHRNKNINEVWFHYSGHGYYTRDHDNDEIDNQDECIVPLDYKKNGIISDDTIYKYFSWLPSGVRCMSIFDSCHSGTIMDLEYKYDYSMNKIKKENKKIINSKIICISGCKDDQTSLDVYNFFEIGKYNGALTSALILILEKFNYHISIVDLVDEIKIYLKKKGFSQIPQLTSSFQINSQTLFCINDEPFIKK